MDKTSLTALGFCVIVGMFAVGFLLDAISQFRATGIYKMPDYVLEYVRLAFQFAFGAGAFAAIREIRRVQREKSNRDTVGALPDNGSDSKSLPGREPEKKDP